MDTHGDRSTVRNGKHRGGNRHVCANQTNHQD